MKKILPLHRGPELEKIGQNSISASRGPIFMFLVSTMGFLGLRNSIEYFLGVCAHCKTSLQCAYARNNKLISVPASCGQNLKFLVSKIVFLGSRNWIEYFLMVCARCKTSLQCARARTNKPNSVPASCGQNLEFLVSKIGFLGSRNSMEYF